MWGKNALKKSLKLQHKGNESMSQPFYHLRPNKYVDRYLFINCLNELGRIIDIKSHRYIGFGSYLFDDFKQVHDRLNIDSMISLEIDPYVHKRAQYNAPYKCIQVIQQSSTDFISGADWGEENSIIWLDYTSPKELASQFNDVAALTNILMAHDILKVTFNANSNSLGGSEITPEDLLSYRLNKLKERIGEYVPTDLVANDITTKRYPKALLQCLKTMLESQYIETEAQPLFFMPLFSVVYQDGQQMVTFTGIVLDSHEEEKEIRRALSAFSYINFEWNEPIQIDIPELTAKEVMEINKLLPCENAEEQLEEEFGYIFEGEKKKERIKSYISYYKYYPNFHSINF